MKDHTFRSRFAIGALLTLSGVVVATLVAGLNPVGNQVTSPSAKVCLRVPAFVNVAHASDVQAIDADPDFLEQEVGISAYTNVGRQIDLAKIEGMLGSIEQRTNEYVVGSMTPPGYAEHPELEEVADVHMYVHRDGWIVAYLVQWQDASLIIDWIGYGNDKLASTTLEDVIRQALTTIGVSATDISYYDFRYPEATTLMLVADVEDDYNEWDTFQVKIPNLDKPEPRRF